MCLLLSESSPVGQTVKHAMAAIFPLANFVFNVFNYAHANMSFHYYNDCFIEGRPHTHTYTYTPYQADPFAMHIETHRLLIDTRLLFDVQKFHL